MVGFMKSPTSWDMILDTNLKGPFICCQEIFQYMIDNGGGQLSICHPLQVNIMDQDSSLCSVESRS